MKTYFHGKPAHNFTGILKLDKRSRSFTTEECDKYEQRVLKAMEFPREDNKVTSILSPNHIRNLWSTATCVTLNNKWELHMTESYDGGTVFEFKLNSEKLPN